MQYLKKEVRDKILSAAVEEFKECGYADASIRNIANNAEISLGNIYRYFTNKESLYFAVINPFMDSIKHYIEKEVAFNQHSMKEISEILISFLMQHSNELMIIRKGNTVHYQAFVSYIVGVISQKIKEMILGAFPEIGTHIHNAEFYNVIAESFLTAIFKVLRQDDSVEVQERNTRELITFFFGHMQDRFYHFDAE